MAPHRAGRAVPQPGPALRTAQWHSLVCFALAPFGADGVTQLQLGELGLEHLEHSSLADVSSGPVTCSCAGSQTMTLMLYLKLMCSWSSAPFPALSHLHG